jgi:Flp pilus assembly protein TadB
MTRYALTIAGFAIALVCVGFAAILIFDRIWYQVGFGAACLVVLGALLLIAWLFDRREKAKRERDIEELSSL